MSAVLVLLPSCATFRALGDLGELFTHREHYDTYVCTRCGKLEFFADGLGEEHRVEA